MLLHGASELRSVVALGIIEFEVLAEPLPNVPVGAFSADISELSHGIDSRSEITKMGRMLLGKHEMVEQMFLCLLRYIIRPEADLLLGQESIG